MIHQSSSPEPTCLWPSEAEAQGKLEARMLDAVTINRNRLTEALTFVDILSTPFSGISVSFDIMFSSQSPS